MGQNLYGSLPSIKKINERITMDESLPPLPVIFLLSIIFICVILGIYAQIKARKYLIPGHGWALRKDSLLRRRDLAYSPEGMRYVVFQRKLIYVMLACFIIITLFYQN